MSRQDFLKRRASRLKTQKSKPTSETSKDLGLTVGQAVETTEGFAFLIEAEYPSGHIHGNRKLADVLEFDSAMAAAVVNQPGLREISFKQLVFLDTETTGLVGGAGTLVFLIGVGVFTEDKFRLRQYFLRDPIEEAGMLTALAGDLEPASGFVTFNGRTFDVPLLEMRYRLGLRKRWSLTSWPQLDLLYPSRRLWKRGLPNCTLNTIEREVLGVERTEADVPGEIIPGIYHDFLRTGYVSGIERVLYHNAVDVLTLVGLAAEVLKRHYADDFGKLSGGEALGLARWHQSSGRDVTAEEGYRSASSSSDASVRLEALRLLTSHLKSQNRREQALNGWQEWHALAPEDPRPCIELAKFYEWHTKDPVEARKWAQEALVCLTHWAEDWRRDRLWAEIEHRLSRLSKKLEDKGS